MRMMEGKKGKEVLDAKVEYEGQSRAPVRTAGRRDSLRFHSHTVEQTSSIVLVYDFRYFALTSPF